MDSRQSESVCATLSQPHYLYLVNEVQKNGLEKAVGNRTNGASTENAIKDVRAMQEIVERNGF